MLADVRLQARISGPGRATVTSAAGMATDLTIIAFYGGYAVLAGAAGHAVAFAVAAAAVPGGGGLAGRLPAARPPDGTGRRRAATSDKSVVDG